MTRIRFYTDVAEPQALIRQLAGQALARQRQVTVYVASQAEAQALSDCLWQSPPDGFLPNALADASHAGLTPVHLAWLPEQIQQDDILLNCQPVQPLFFGRFRHLFEIVPQTDVEKVAARQRWAFYRDRGYEIQHMKNEGRV